MTCRVCKSNIEEGDFFCKECGTLVTYNNRSDKESITDIEDSNVYSKAFEVNKVKENHGYEKVSEITFFQLTPWIIVAVVAILVALSCFIGYKIGSAVQTEENVTEEESSQTNDLFPGGSEGCEDETETDDDNGDGGMWPGAIPTPGEELNPGFGPKMPLEPGTDSEDVTVEPNETPGGKGKIGVV